MLKLIEQIKTHPIMEGFVKDGLPVRMDWKERRADITPREAVANFVEFQADLDGVKAIIQYILVAPFTNAMGVEQVSVWQRQLTSATFTGDDEEIPFAQVNRELEYAERILKEGQGDPWTKAGITIEWELDSAETAELNAGNYNPVETATVRRSWSGEFQQYPDVLGVGSKRAIGTPQVAGDPHKVTTTDSSAPGVAPANGSPAATPTSESNGFTVHDLIQALNKVGGTGKLDSSTSVVVVLSDGESETELGIQLGSASPLMLDPKGGNRVLLRVTPLA